MIDTVIEAAKAGGTLALKYFSNLPKVTYKQDNSPVTIADVEVEKLIRKIIAKKFPGHGFRGEELKPINQKAKYQWIIDPIDGTREFVRSIPHWAIFIALLENGNPIASVMHFPAMNFQITAQKGKGAKINGKKPTLSKVKNLKDARINIGSVKRYLKNQSHQKSLIKLIEACESPRIYGNLALIYLLEGKIDALVEPQGGIHDFAAPSLVIEEAGGKFTNFKGKLDLESGTCVISNGLIHNEIVKLLKP